MRSTQLVLLKQQVKHLIDEKRRLPSMKRRRTPTPAGDPSPFLSPFFFSFGRTPPADSSSFQSAGCKKRSSSPAAGRMTPGHKASGDGWPGAWVTAEEGGRGWRPMGEVGRGAAKRKEPRGWRLGFGGGEKGCLPPLADHLEAPIGQGPGPSCPKSAANPFFN